MRWGILAGLGLLACLLGAQTPPANEPPTNVYPGELLPPGLRDIDRAKTLMIGTFPFAYLLSNWGYDFYYYANKNFDQNFTPWPLGQGTASLTGAELQDKYKTLIISSLVLSGALALLDFILGLLEPPPGPRIDPPDADANPEG